MGLEPTTYGTTIRRSNQLSYIHHIALTGVSLLKSVAVLKSDAKLRTILIATKFLNYFF